MGIHRSFAADGSAKLIVPLWAVSLLAKRIIPAHTPYVEVKYWQALALSTAYLTVIILEPLADLAVLAAAKLLADRAKGPMLYNRLYHPAT